MFVIFSTYIIDHCPYKKYARGSLCRLPHGIPRARTCKPKGCHVEDGGTPYGGCRQPFYFINSYALCVPRAS